MHLKLKDVLGPLVGLVVLTVGLLQYRSTTYKDFIRPVREAQLKLYLEASSAAAQIATLDRGTDAWGKSRDEFLRLYYGPLAIVEDYDHGAGETALSVEEAMIIFKSCLDNESRCEKLDASLIDLSLALAHTCRESLSRSWGYNVEQLKGDYQTRALSYRKKVREP